MSSGKQHESFNQTIIVLTLIISLFLLKEYAVYVIQVHIFALIGTYYWNCDNDMARTNPTNNWGKLKFLVLPYSGLNPHRGKSHKFIIGTIQRYRYMLTVLSIIVMLVNISVYSILARLTFDFDIIKMVIIETWKIEKIVIDFFHIDWKVFLTSFAGFFYSDCLHLIKDR